LYDTIRHKLGEINSESRATPIPYAGSARKEWQTSLRFIFRHDLDAETPPRIIAALDVFEKVSLG
jgi:hypothetical protein